jgi:hypothetical protein
MDRNYLRGRDGDRTNAARAAAGYSLLLRSLAELCVPSSLRTPAIRQTAVYAQAAFFTATG